LKIEHLEVLLKRAGSLPLDLYIDGINGEAQIEMLGIISSRKCLIRSLTVDELEEHAHDFPNQIFDNMNMNPLTNLSLLGTSEDLANRIMDLALPPSQNPIMVEIQKERISLVPLLQHRLLKRSVKLELINRQ
jgi:hypothetical protein